MNRTHVKLADCAGDIIRALPHGVLLTAKSGRKLNTMTIGWGTLGIEWAKPMFIAYIREGRYTRELLDENPEFTVSIPSKGRDPAPIRFCGTHSGRTTDKFSEAGLTTVEPEVISVPAILEYPLTLECRIVHRSVQMLDTIAPEFLRFYPADVDSTDCGRNHDAHVVYYGQIVSSYYLE